MSLARILIVEDDAVLSELIRLHLESDGHQVAIAPDGLLGLKYALSFQPDAIVSDLHMPNLDGIGLLAALRAQSTTASMPVILLTADAGAKSISRAREYGVSDYLVKPFNRTDLLGAITMQLDALKDSRRRISDEESTGFASTQINAVARTQTIGQSMEPTHASARTEESTALEDAPIHVKGYQLLRKIGQGGVAEVYLAQQRGAAEPHVLKIVHLTDVDDGDTLQRFIAEYALLSQIVHPNVARIFKQGFADDFAYIAMEYFSGGDLRAVMRTGGGPDIAIATLLQVAGGLGAVHAAGIVHRDLKPDNIMIRDDGTLAIADFGIAKYFGAHHGLTQHGQVVGTPYYVSPEQALGLAVDQRSDVYSLGVMLYEMLTGLRAYYAESAMELLEQHVTAPVPRLPDEFRHFQVLLEAMMCKDVERRLPNAVSITDFIVETGLV